MIRLKKRKRQKMGVRTSNVVRSAAHLQFIRSHECIVLWGGQSDHPKAIPCRGKVQACHVREDMHSAMAQKPGDDQCIPGCLDHHYQLDRLLGRDEFERVYRMKPGELLRAAALLARKSKPLQRRMKELQDA